MKRVICDQCRKEVEPTPYGLSPEGWVRIQVQDKKFTEPLDLCGLQCALVKISDMEAEDTKAKDAKLDKKLDEILRA